MALSRMATRAPNWSLTITKPKAQPRSPASGVSSSESGALLGNSLHRIKTHLLAPVDNSFLVFLRIVFGAIMAWEVYRYFAGDRISRYYVKPILHFTYYGFSWVTPWPGDGMFLHFLALGVLAAWIMVGFWYRISAALFFLGFTYVFLLDQTQYLNHFYLISLLSFLLIFLPAGCALSVDAWMHPKRRSDTAPAWTLWLLRAQLGIVYFYGGLAKLNGDWLGGEPMRMWLAQSTDFPVIGKFFKEEWMVYQFVVGGLLIDLFIVPLLLWKRTRVYAFVAAVAFHLLNAQLFDIGIFPWLMLAATLVFFPPDLMRRVVHAVRRLGSRGTRTAQHSEKEAVPRIAELSRTQKIAAALLSIYLAVQVLMPLRHFLYPGDVNWTEEGHNFSWHMKLRDKEADAQFTITDPASGEVWKVDLRRYLEPRQRDKMVTRPDMILQFCHYLAEEKRRAGYENVEVRAHVMASLNGRKEQLLIDPEIDLAKEPRNLLPARWIVPLTEPLSDRDTSHGIHPDSDN